MTHLTYGAASITQRGMIQHVTYREFAHQEQRSGKCRCGKRRTRSQQFTETMSPFNKGETGAPKTARQIMDSLRSKGAKWVPDFTCASHEWAALNMSIVGNPDAGFETVYYLGQRVSLRSAQREGARNADGTDDFRLVILDGDRLIAMTDAEAKPFDWTPEDYAEDCAEVAERLGLTFEAPA